MGLDVTASSLILPYVHGKETFSDVRDSMLLIIVDPEIHRAQGAYADGARGSLLMSLPSDSWTTRTAD